MDEDHSPSRSTRTDTSEGTPPPTGGRRRATRYKSRRRAYLRRRLGAVVALAGLLLLLAVGSRLVLGGESSPTLTSSPATNTTPSPKVLSATPDQPIAGGVRSLKVVTNPEGASVTVAALDGSFRQTTNSPGTIEAPRGHLSVAVSREGYETVERAFALDRDAELRLWLDPEGLLHRSILRFRSGSNPKQVAFTPDGRELWVSLLGGKGVEVFSALTGARLGEVRLGKHGAVEVIFSSDGSTAYVSQMETASVYEIDRVSRQVRRQMPTGGSWTKVMALSPDESTLYAANWSSNDVSEIDLATGETRRRIKTVPTPRGLYPTPDGRSLYVAGYDDGQIEKIDLASGEGKVLLETGGAMRHLVGDLQSGLVYADDMATDEVFVVDPATDKVSKLADTDEKPNTIDLTPDGKVLYVSNRGENGTNYYLPGPEWGSVLAIDTKTGRVLDAIVGGNQTTGLDVSPDGRVLAFSDFLDNRIYLYTIPEYQTLEAGNGGRARAHLAELKK